MSKTHVRLVEEQELELGSLNQVLYWEVIEGQGSRSDSHERKCFSCRLETDNEV